ncbi:putative follistatin [Operophtera brumata]|uniref:Putative follistatin n=1 Tax=Operophtera brumata TaxID=104452 RepID=A0A0L7LJ26_OPEBR|nr:putative follistatin [Operophtera brumata]
MDRGGRCSSVASLRRYLGRRCAGGARAPAAWSPRDLDSGEIFFYKALSGGVPCTACAGTTLCMQNIIRYLGRRCAGGACAPAAWSPRNLDSGEIFFYKALSGGVPCTVCAGTTLCMHNIIRYLGRRCAGGARAPAAWSPRNLDSGEIFFYKALSGGVPCTACAGTTLCMQNIIRYLGRRCAGGARAPAAWSPRDLDSGEIFFYKALSGGMPCTACAGTTLCMHNIIRYLGRRCAGGARAPAAWSPRDLDRGEIFFYKALSGGSCAGVSCSPGRRCVVRGGRARCVCAAACRRVGAVCGSDGKTYPSLCRLRRKACRRPAKHLKLLSQLAERALNVSGLGRVISRLPPIRDHTIRRQY